MSQLGIVIYLRNFASWYLLYIYIYICAALTVVIDNVCKQAPAKSEEMDVEEVEEPQEPGEEQEVENEELEVSQIMYNLQVNQTMFGFT